MDNTYKSNSTPFLIRRRDQLIETIRALGRVEFRHDVLKDTDIIDLGSVHMFLSGDLAAVRAELAIRDRMMPTQIAS